MYIAIRRDLSVPQQVVQSCHAAIEASKVYHENGDIHPSVISIDVKSEEALRKFKEHAEQGGFITKEFREPNMDHQITSVAVYPVSEDQRGYFRKYQLLKDRGGWDGVIEVYRKDPEMVFDPDYGWLHVAVQGEIKDLEREVARLEAELAKPIPT